MERATEYFKGDTLAANVWMNKYALKDSDGNIYELTPDDMHHRLAAEIARIEKKYKNPVDEATIYDLFRNFKYIIPQGSPMAGIGNNLQVSSLSNCFVIGSDSNYDSYGGIMKIDQEQVQLMKRRGGVGHDLSHIRPTGSPVKNSALTSTGIVPFMERYSNSTREVAQDGRRGALMLTISVKHPDAERFIDAKLELGKVTGANVSVKIDDDFMQSVVKGIPYMQKYPIVGNNPQKEQEIDATVLWNKIIHNAWQSAEPGVLFWDTIIRESVPDCYADLGFKTLSTNPCGEIPLCPYDSCRLLAINLFSYVDHPFTGQARFNFDKFKKHSAYALRIMDDIIDLETEKIDAILAKVKADPEDAEVKRIEQKLWENIRQKTLQGRRTGIGITAEGDMLAALGLRYGTDEATAFSIEVHKTLATEVYGASADLAAERGAFPLYSFEREKNNPFIQRLKEASPEVYEKMARHGRRNIAMLTIAPTGSVSICTQTTSGIEPVFMVTYTRRRKVNPNDKNANVTFVDGIGDSWEEYVVFHPKFVDWLVAKGYDPDEVKRYKPDQLQELVMQSPYYKATSQDINWLNKVKMQGAIQKWVDHSISVTVNLPADATEELVSDVYKTAWESGCKGMTIYRDGCRDGVLVTNENKPENTSVFRETTAPARPEKIEADIVRFQNDYEKWLAVIGLLDGKPYEIFTGKAEGFYLPAWVQKGWVIRNKTNNEPARYDFQFLDKDGYKVTIEGLSRSFNKEFWNYAKLISGILRHGMPLPFLVNLIDNLNFDNDSITTWKNGVVRALKRYIPDGTQIKSRNACPSCKEDNTLVYKEGCLTCGNCGYSQCS
ncbi:MAG: adenosylcobalamin-dependent ribonucleoside-diphosphate reductase [Lentimicrobiaceae bacterium]|nr:adenosylcobalamin-dependent ribonucleoside-diphosphate reductase [Lentimicrobiaceae bacterium]MDD4597542.1 adenosylcobalamin-dependent ribonucleoside-diphosphate reductase [Lentimicrobiaceae bacterium]MDY0024641.1 adenosylcobalamin-dependent ribonucleoside-diphosphate reductase [Lentimicrobium sp.]